MQLYKEVQAPGKGAQDHKVRLQEGRAITRGEPSVPAHTTYLKLVYSAEMPPLPFDVGAVLRQGVRHAHDVPERLLLKRKIMGPCWLKLAEVAPSTSTARQV